MPVIVSGIKCPIGTDGAGIILAAIKALGISETDVISAGVHKISIDARNRDNMRLVCSAVIELKNAHAEKRLSRRENCRVYCESKPQQFISSRKKEGRTVIAGFGPAGMFCAMMLAENGYRPVVLERGADVDARAVAVEGFFGGGALDPISNVQFGEGGAGTFSDGKLTTRIGDPLCRYVLKRFNEFGAPDEILYLAKPHIGTDNLRLIVKNIRNRIISLGGEIRFLTRLDGVKSIGGEIKSAITSAGEIDTAALVLAIGHSARDTFEMLLKSGVNLEPKPFSIGARIEHRQLDVDLSLYGAPSEELFLPKGEYQLSHRCDGGRAVYTFCMCPGGSVIAAASEPGGIVTNGMSSYLRDGKNANAALVVSVSKEDFPQGALGGVELQREIERRAYKLSGSYMAPAQTVGSFLGECGSSASLIPSYLPGVVNSDLNRLFPPFILDMLKQGLRKFSHNMECFKDMGAILTAPETRTSSPVRIIRNENGTALGFDNLYPCGEGAGYAGGIMSAAVDGLRAALKIMASYSPE